MVASWICAFSPETARSPVVNSLFQQRSLSEKCLVAAEIACGHTDRLHIRPGSESLLCLPYCFVHQVLISFCLIGFIAWLCQCGQTVKPRTLLLPSFDPDTLFLKTWAAVYLRWSLSLFTLVYSVVWSIFHLYELKTRTSSSSALGRTSCAIASHSQLQRRTHRARPLQLQHII